MTTRELIERGRAVAGWLLAHPVAAIGLIFALLVFLNVRSCNRAGEAEGRAVAAEERARLAAGRQVPVVEPVEDLRPALNKALAENATLKEAMARAGRAAPGAKPVGVVQASTGPRPAGGTPRPSWPCSPSAPCAAPAQAPAECPPSLLAPGDSTEIRVDEVLLETRAGNHLLVGAATTWRLEPGPPTAIAWGAFEAPFTAAVEKPSPAPPAGRWGAGPLAGAGRGGWLAGALVATPSARLPLLGWQLEALAGGAAGPTGDWFALAGVVVRP